MFDSFFAVPLHFTIEFIGFLVAAGGAFLVASRPSLIPGGSSSRGSATIGFAALAVAQVGHGGSFESLAADNAEILIALKTLGFALILIGVVGGVGQRAAASALLPAGPFTIAPALAAAAVSLMAFVGSVRGGTRDLRRLAFGTLFLAVGEAILAAAPPGGEVPLQEFNEIAAHGVRGLGYISLAAWLWTGVRSSIRTRFVASFVALLVVVVLALSTALTGVITDNIEDSELDRVARQMRNVLDVIERSERAALSQDARQVAEILPVQVAVATGGDQEAVAREIFRSQLFEADAVVLTDQRGRLLGRWGHAGSTKTTRRDLRAEGLFDILGSEPVRAVIEGRVDFTPVELARIDRSVAIVAASAVLDPNDPNRVVGAVALVDFLDFLTVENVSANVAVDASLVIGRRVTASVLEGDISGADLVPRDARGQITGADRITTRTQRLGGTTYYSAIAELRREDGGSVGHIVLSSPAQEVANPARQGVTQTLFLVALGVGAIVLVLAYFSGRRITRPIQELTATAQRVREGDLKAQTDVSGEDEVGQLGETFNEMTTALFRMTNDLRAAAREEHQLRARIETIIESMADGLVAVNENGRILAFNREAEAITGVPSSEAIGAPVEEIVAAVDSQGERLGLPIYDLGEGSASGIFIERRGDDPVPATVVSAVLRTEDDATAGGVAVIRDMTREREVERMKSEFLSNISHELRTPLTPIKGYAEILHRKEMPADKTRQFSKGILESTQRLERIVELLVDFAALEAGRLSPRAASVDLADMVQRLAEEWEGKTPRHQIVTDVGARLPKVIGDERLLKRSLEEILDNAVKFSPQGGKITLKVKGAVRGNGHERRKGTRSVEITISDEGIGIPAEDVSKIFSDFQQLDGSETRTYGGLGLGLAFVRRIVEAHDGSIRVDSQPEQGTHLTVSIPAAARRGAPPETAND